MHLPFQLSLELPGVKLDWDNGLGEKSRQAALVLSHPPPPPTPPPVGFCWGWGGGGPPKLFGRGAGAGRHFALGFLAPSLAFRTGAGPGTAEQQPRPEEGQEKARVSRTTSSSANANSLESSPCYLRCSRTTDKAPAGISLARTSVIAHPDPLTSPAFCGTENRNITPAER